MARLCLALITVLLSARCALATEATITNYDVTLTIPSTVNSTTSIDGTTVITATYATGDSNSLTLHWGDRLSDPTSKDTTYALSQGTSKPTVTPSQKDTSGIVTLSWPANTTTDGAFTLTINHKTTVGKDAMGLFYRQFTNADASTSTLVMTDLRPAYAREVFPCKDDLSSYAFTLQLTRTNGWQSAASFAAGTPVAGTGVTTDVYAITSPDTLPASFLSFFVTSDFIKSNYTTSSGTTLNFWASKDIGAIKLAKNAEFLGSYFAQIESTLGVAMHGGKVEVVLVPNLAKPFGGFGVVYIREDIYYNLAGSPQTEGTFRTLVLPAMLQLMKQFTEYSVKLISWGDQWLSEALTNYLTYSILNSVGYSIDLPTELAVVGRQTALQLDTANAEALAKTFDSTATTTDFLAYINNPLKGLKGLFLLNTIDMSFTVGTILKFFNGYLTTKSTKLDFTTTNFFKALSNAVTTTGTDATSARDALTVWSSQPGYPLVTITDTTPSNTSAQGSVSLTMDPCPSNLTSSTCTTANPQFYAFVTVGSKTDPRNYSPREGLWLTVTSATTPVTAKLDIASNDWVVANVKSTGYYRTQYTKSNWAQILSALKAADASLMGRSHLIDDAFALASAGTLDYQVALNLSVANARELLYRNWYPVYRGLSQLRDQLYGQSLFPSYQSFAIPLLQNVNTLLQTDDLDPFENARIFSLFQDQLCEFSLPNVRSYAFSNTTTLLAGSLPSLAPSSSYEAMVCCAGQYDTSLKASTLWANLGDASANYTKKHYSAVALGCLADYPSVSGLFDKILVAEGDVKPHVMTTFNYLAEKNSAKILANLTTFATKIQAQLGSVGFANVIAILGRKLNTADQATKLSNVTETVAGDTVVQSAVKAAVASVNTRAAYVTAQADVLKKALAASTPAAKSAAIVPAILSLTLLSLLLVALSVT